MSTKLVKVDLFKADKAMSERVADFMRTKVWGITLKARCKKEIETTEASIDGLRKLDGSVLGEKGQESIIKLQARITELQDTLAKQLKEEATFELTENDKTLYKSYKEAGSVAEVTSAIITWFSAYHLEVTKDSDIVVAILSAISGMKRASAKTIINSGATQFVESKRTKTDIVGLFYGTLAERMLEVGTLKPTSIQEDVRDFYAPKKKAKKEEPKTENTEEAASK